MDLPVIAVDLVAMLIIAYALYYPRHRRKDLVVAFLVVNVGVLGVSTVLAQSTVGAGLGLDSSVSCPSSDSAPKKSATAKSPTTSPHSPSGSSPGYPPPSPQQC